MSKPRRWILGALAAVAATLIVIPTLFDWNWLKGPIDCQVSAALGRPFRITGDLDVDLSLEPRITIEGAELANASWGSDTPMAKVERAEVLVDVLKLLQGELVLPEVNITKPELLLETVPNSPPNWQFGQAEEPSQGPPAIPVIGRLEVSDASIRYHDLGDKRSVTAVLTRIAGSTGSPEGGLKLNATGRVQGERLDLEVTGAPLAARENRAEPYSASLALKFGESDLGGDLTLDLSKQVPRIRAKLASHQVKTTNLVSLLAAPPPDAGRAGRAHSQERPAGGEERASTGGTATLEAISGNAKLPAVDADLQYAIGKLEGPDLTLQDVSLNTSLHDRSPSFVLTGHGQYKGHPILLDVQAGAAKGEQGRGATFVIDARIEAGQTRIAASGGISDPERLEGLKVQFEIVSPDAHELLGELGVEAPALPPLQAAGNIVREGTVWQLNDAYAQVGESNLAGRLSVDLSRPRPFISADLESERLRAQDLITTQPERQAAAGEGPESAADDSASLLIAAGINFDALPKVDADVTFRGGYIEAPEARLDRLQFDLKLRHRVAVIDATGEGRFRERQPITFAVHAGTEDSLRILRPAILWT